MNMSVFKKVFIGQFLALMLVTGLIGGIGLVFFSATYNFEDVAELEIPLENILKNFEDKEEKESNERELEKEEFRVQHIPKFKLLHESLLSGIHVVKTSVIEKSDEEQVLISLHGIPRYIYFSEIKIPTDIS